MSYRDRLVLPDLPAPSDYLPLLEQMQDNGWYSNFGPLSRELETRLLDRFGHPGEACVTCSNATAGLSAALIAAGRSGPCLIPAFTFPASLGAVRAAGLTPVVGDVDPSSWALDGERLDMALARSGATSVMLVNPFGMSRDWTVELAICRRRDVAVVIDNASGLGAPRGSGQQGEDVFEVFSMHATKPFAVGEGGVVFARRERDAALRSALNFALAGPVAETAGPDWGFNGKMSEIHAAIGIAQCRRFDGVLDRRQRFAALLRDRLARCPSLVCPHDIGRAPWQFFPVLLPDAGTAERFIAAAAGAGVEIRRYYRPSLSTWPNTPAVGRCPVAEDLADRMCVLPVRATIGPDADGLIDRVVGALAEVVGDRS